MFSDTRETSAFYQIILLRHGESEGNAAGLHQGQSDFPLNGLGRSQARALGQHWKATGQSFDQIVSSPLSRARQTAEIIGALVHAAVELDEDWMERDNGLLSGLHRDEAHKVYPRPAFIPPFQPIGSTGESQWELYLRGGRALHKLLRQPPGRYLVVSHGGILNMVMYAVLGIAPQANFNGPSFRFGNTSFATLTYQPAEHRWTLIGVNERPHWKEKHTRHV